MAPVIPEAFQGWLVQTADVPEEEEEPGAG
jgi:hypothetical protein